MTRLENLKAELAEMSAEDFTKKFIAGGVNRMKEHICGDIKHPQAHCTKTDDYSCLECLRAFLRSEVK